MSRSYEGSIYKTPDGKRYFARLRYTDASGKPREKKRVCVTHAKAKSMIDTLRSEIENEINERWTYQQLDAFYRKNYVHGAKFVGGIKVSGFKQNLNIISSYLDTALAHFNGRWIDEITFGDIENYK